MKRQLTCLAVVLYFLPLPIPLARADLQSDITAALSTKTAAKGQIGIEVIRLGADAGSSPVVYRRNAEAPLVPASNMKLLTTSAALDGLGGDFQFVTKLMQRGDSLVIVGDGDPSIGDAELLKKHGWTVTTLFESWAELLKSRGINRVGDIIIDDGVFDQQFANPHWPADQLHKRYVAQVGGLNVNANCIDFYLNAARRGSTVTYRTDPVTSYAAVTNSCISGPRNAVWLSRDLGSNRVVLKGELNASLDEPVSVTIDDPGLYFGAVFAETLRKSGIVVGAQVMRDREAHNWTDTALLAKHQTPIDVVLRRANKDSMNLYAECLIKRLGAAASGGRDGSWQSGVAAVGRFLAARGAGEPKEATIIDGSGLSRENRVSANVIARVLLADYFSPNRQAMMDTLAVGGIDGTLDNRFEGPLKGRVFAKTGYVTGARCLSGYLRTTKDNWYAFSILINGPVGSEGKRMQEQIVAAIDAND